ncbi:MAG: glycosyltransferase family 4 protein [Candidimonas sp.]|nr:glycosyltransferase family 4 protein [Candidimonas sp.]
MKILIISFYYSPDLCAGSFRATALVEAMLRKTPAEAHIDVLTTAPNRYSTFAVEAPAAEEAERLSISRIQLPAHRSGMADQSRAFGVFSRGVLKAVRDKHYDIVIGTSSRLMTAVLSAYVAKRKRARLYLDIRDIFVDTIKDVLPRKFAAPAKPIFALAEHWAVSRADRVNLVSQGFSNYFETRYPRQQRSFFTNGIDEEFLRGESSESHYTPGGMLEILYAGNIGEGQGLHDILPQLAIKLQGRASFTVIGDGGRKEALANALVAAGARNVTLLAPMPRQQLIDHYGKADVLFLHLNDYAAFRKVLPSKIFEYAAMKKPILAGVAGFPAEFLQREVTNCAIFPPCDAEAAIKALDRLAIVETVREDFVHRYGRSRIMDDMADDILSLMDGKRE